MCSCPLAAHVFMVLVTAQEPASIQLTHSGHMTWNMPVLAGALVANTPVPVLTVAPGTTPAPTKIALRGASTALATSAVRLLQVLGFRGRSRGRRKDLESPAQARIYMVHTLSLHCGAPHAPLPPPRSAPLRFLGFRGTGVYLYTVLQGAGS